VACWCGFSDLVVSTKSPGITNQCESQVKQTLDSNRFSALEKLLNQSEMYTQFLSEQIKDCEDKVEGSTKPTAAAIAAPSKGGKKAHAKGGKRSRNGAAKKAEEPKEPELAPTQVRATPFAAWSRSCFMAVHMDVLHAVRQTDMRSDLFGALDYRLDLLVWILVSTASKLASTSC